MTRRLAVLVLVLIAFGAAAWTDPSESALQRAALAWEAGDYVAALETYRQLLDSSAADAVLEAIALQTGELYTTTELTPDGTAPRFSPDGRLISYEVPTMAPRTTVVVESAAARRTVAELHGIGAAFSPDGSRLAYLVVSSETPLSVRSSRVAIRDLASGRETLLGLGDLRATSLIFGAGGNMVVGAAPDGGGVAQLYSVAEGRPPRPLTSGGDVDRIPGAVDATGAFVTFTLRAARGAGARGGGGAAGRGGRASLAGSGAAPGPVQTFGVVSIAGGTVTMVSGAAPAFSRDGSAIAYVAREGDEYQLAVAPVTDLSNATILRRGPERIDAPAWSPDGTRLAYQLMPREDWEIYTITRDGSAETRVTREIQHDVLPRFLNANRLLAAIGEPRHRRSYLYELPSGARTRLFHNNTVRTIAPEYLWVPDMDGTHVLIAAERDGDTISPQRGVYLVDLTRHVTRDELRARVIASLEREKTLRARARRMYAPIAEAVRQVVARASEAQVYAYEKALFDFDSKYITQPGNQRAAEYLFNTYKSFGYAPEYQWFEPRTAPARTANVVATLRGTVNPDTVYVVSSHYDSVSVGPGADDDSSGTAALLETARILAGHPLPATVVFASFTGEEAGLLGSREFVRRAVENRVNVAGALNNDMIGWANDERLDNTIRYSNPGIRDLQHGAALQFTNLITYDALYYKSTDAAAYYDAFGDIVGGIGSYPVLGNPHYHQSHDLLETINHRLVTEVAKTTAASVMLLASSPARLKGLTIDRAAHGAATVSWTPSPESGVTAYLVQYGPASRPQAYELRVAKPSATLPRVSAGTEIAVKAVNANGLEGWDWARVVVK